MIQQVVNQGAFSEHLFNNFLPVMLVKEGDQIIDENVELREVISVMVLFDFWEEELEPALKG